MPSAATNLQAVVNGNNVSFTWNIAQDQGADAQWLDIATEPGFVNYVLQAGPISPPSPSPNLIMPCTNSFNYTLQQGGLYWVRINTHYPGYGTFPNDRGWFPSAHIAVQIAGGPPLPTGSPVSDLHWTNGVISWTNGSGTMPITRLALDFSTFPNFDDILASPFVAPVGGTGIIIGLPYAFDVPVSLHQLQIQGLPAATTIYARVNTLYGNLLWVPGSILRFNPDGSVTGGGSGGINPLWIAAAAGGALLLAAMTEENQ